MNRLPRRQAWIGLIFSPHGARPDGAGAPCPLSRQGCPPRPCPTHWCSFPWRASRPRRTRPRQNRLLKPAALAMRLWPHSNLRLIFPVPLAASQFAQQSPYRCICGGCLPRCASSCRIAKASGRFMCSAIAVARPVGVIPTTRRPSQRKCSRHATRRGSNNTTSSPVCGRP